MPVSRLIEDLDRLMSQFGDEGSAAAPPFRDLRMTIARVNDLRRQLDAAQLKLGAVLSLVESRVAERQAEAEGPPRMADHRFGIPDDGGTGIPQVDDAQAALFESGNRLYTLTLGHDPAPGEMETALSGLVESIGMAFGAEEGIMEAARYPRLDAHRQVHRRMLAYLEEMREVAESDPLAVAVKLEHLLGAWFLLHRQRQDMDFGRHCRRGAADAGSELADPVCGASVGASSPYRCAHGGVTFHFCSDECRTRFLADPALYADVRFFDVEDAAPAERPKDAIAEVQEAHAAHAPSGEAGTPEAPGPLRSAISSWLLARRERRYAAQMSREMLALYHSLSADHPGTSEREILKLAVIAHAGCDTAEAEWILQAAEESFADWPVRRELTLCDVVHYLSATEFLDFNESDHWLHAEVQEVIATRIPPELCATRKRSTTR